MGYLTDSEGNAIKMSSIDILNVQISNVNTYKLHMAYLPAMLKGMKFIVNGKDITKDVVAGAIGHHTLQGYGIPSDQQLEELGIENLRTSDYVKNNRVSQTLNVVDIYQAATSLSRLPPGADANSRTPKNGVEVVLSNLERSQNTGEFNLRAVSALIIEEVADEKAKLRLIARLDQLETQVKLRTTVDSRNVEEEQQGQSQPSLEEIVESAETQGLSPEAAIWVNSDAIEMPQTLRESLNSNQLIQAYREKVQSFFDKMETARNSGNTAVQSKTAKDLEQIVKSAPRGAAVGSGVFGSTFLVTNNREQLALKVGRRPKASDVQNNLVAFINNPLLFVVDIFNFFAGNSGKIDHEFDILKELSGIRGVPQAKEKYSSRIYTQQYIDGQNIEQYFVSNQNVNENNYNELNRIVNEIHERQITHEDIHEGNVLIDGQGSVFLIDFGKARERRDFFFGLGALFRFAAEAEDISLIERLRANYPVRADSDQQIDQQTNNQDQQEETAQTEADDGGVGAVSDEQESASRGIAPVVIVSRSSAQIGLLEGDVLFANQQEEYESQVSDVIRNRNTKEITIKGIWPEYSENLLTLNPEEFKTMIANLREAEFPETADKYQRQLFSIQKNKDAYDLQTGKIKDENSIEAKVRDFLIALGVKEEELYNPLLDPDIAGSLIDKKDRLSTGEFRTVEAAEVLAMIPGVTQDIIRGHDIRISYDGRNVRLTGGSGGTGNTNRNAVDNIIDKIIEQDVISKRIAANQQAARRNFLKYALYDGFKLPSVHFFTENSIRYGAFHVDENGNRKVYVASDIEQIIKRQNPSLSESEVQAKVLEIKKEIYLHELLHNVFREMRDQSGLNMNGIDEEFLVDSFIAKMKGEILSQKNQEVLDSFKARISNADDYRTAEISSSLFSLKFEDAGERLFELAHDKYEGEVLSQKQLDLISAEVAARLDICQV